MIGFLCSRSEWAESLLKEVESERIPKSAVSAFHARQILALESPELEKRLEKA